MRFFNYKPYLVIALEVIAFFVFMEASTRWYEASHASGASYRYRYNPVYFWKLREQFRGLAYCPAKTPGTFRILVLGDSTVYGGDNIPPEFSFEMQLQRLLQNHLPGLKVEVMNAGVPAYSSYQGWYFFCDECRRYNPDIVIVSYRNNDINTDSMPDKARNPLPESLKTLALCLNKSELVNVLQELIISKRYFYRHQGSSPQGQNREALRVSPRDYRSNLEKFARLKTTGGIREVLWLAMPYNRFCNNEDVNQRMLKYTGIMQQVAAEYHEPFYNFIASWGSLPGPELSRLFFFNDDTHFNVRGQILMARELYAYMVKQNLLTGERQ